MSISLRFKAIFSTVSGGLAVALLKWVSCCGFVTCNLLPDTQLQTNVLFNIFILVCASHFLPLASHLVATFVHINAFTRGYVRQ